MKHTPKPWQYHNGDETYIIHPNDSAARLWFVCRVYGQPRCPNARLIIAAPDLLEACEMLIASDVDPDGEGLLDGDIVLEALEMAYAAIAKVVD